MKTELEEILKTHGIGKYTVEQKTLHQNILNAMEEAVLKLGKSEVGKVPTDKEICTHEITEKGSCVACEYKYATNEDNSISNLSSPVKQTEEKPLSVEDINNILFEYRTSGKIRGTMFDLTDLANSIYKEMSSDAVIFGQFLQQYTPIGKVWFSVNKDDTMTGFSIYELYNSKEFKEFKTNKTK